MLQAGPPSTTEGTPISRSIAGFCYTQSSRPHSRIPPSVTIESRQTLYDQVKKSLKTEGFPISDISISYQVVDLLRDIQSGTV